VVISCAQYLRKQIKHRFSGGFVTFEPTAYRFFLEKSVIGFGLLTIFPACRWAEEQNTFRCPVTHSDRLKVGMIASDGYGR
jgi:hypothetical protein